MNKSLTIRPIIRPIINPTVLTGILENKRKKLIRDSDICEIGSLIEKNKNSMRTNESISKNNQYQLHSTNDSIDNKNDKADVRLSVILRQYIPLKECNVSYIHHKRLIGVMNNTRTKESVSNRIRITIQVLFVLYASRELPLAERGVQRKNHRHLQRQKTYFVGAGTPFITVLFSNTSVQILSQVAGASYPNLQPHDFKFVSEFRKAVA